VGGTNWPLGAPQPISSPRQCLHGTFSIHPSLQSGKSTNPIQIECRRSDDPVRHFRDDSTGTCLSTWATGRSNGMATSPLSGFGFNLALHYDGTLVLELRPGQHKVVERNRLRPCVKSWIVNVDNVFT